MMKRPSREALHRPAPAASRLPPPLPAGDCPRVTSPFTWHPLALTGGDPTAPAAPPGPSGAAAKAPGAQLPRGWHPLLRGEALYVFGALVLAVPLTVPLAAAVIPPGHGRGPSYTPLRSVPRGLTALATATTADVPAAPPRGLRAPGPPAAAGEDTSASRTRDVVDALVSRVCVRPGGGGAAAAAERLRSGKLPALGSAARPEGGAGSASRGECPAIGGATDIGTSCLPSEERDVVRVA